MVEHANGNDLVHFMSAVWRRMDERVGAAPFAAAQRELLCSTLDYYRQRISANPFADPLAFFYLVVLAEHGRLDERAEWLGALCRFYLFALDLIDDVQDEDLAGKPHAEVGPAVAVNSGMTLFALALAALHQAMTLEADKERRTDYLKLLTRICLDASSGQHLDLTTAAETANQALAIHRNKGSSIVLVIECAALHSGTNAASLLRYREAAEHLSILVQVVGDLRDLFGKPASPDLTGGKATHPLAAFRELAAPEQHEQFAELLRQGSIALPGIRKLLYASGAIRRSAEAIEDCRKHIHAAIAGLNKPHPALRTWLHLVDNLASLIYVPPSLEESRVLLQPEGLWHETVRDLAARFADDLRPFGAPSPPQMIPWPHPQWIYEPRRKTIFYPDLQDQRDQILPWAASLLGSKDLEWVQSILVRQAPAVMAHELFHHWRDAAGRLTTDFWYEELAANRLAIAYMKRFRPELAETTRDISEHALSAHHEGLSPQAQQILGRLLAPDRGPEKRAPGYGITMDEAALIQLAMIPYLLDEDTSPEEVISQLLAPV